MYAIKNILLKRHVLRARKSHWKNRSSSNRIYFAYNAWIDKADDSLKYSVVDDDDTQNTVMVFKDP